MLFLMMSMNVITFEKKVLVVGVFARGDRQSKQVLSSEHLVVHQQSCGKFEVV
jgi:hypothetical protein